MIDTKHIPFSVCMSVYKNDDPSDFQTAIRSVTVQQKIQPDEVILVADGPIPETLQQVITSFSKEYKPLRFIPLETNQGHAIARQTAIEASRYEWVAVMDSDDIALPDRFEKQLEYIASHPDIDVIGGQITEFAYRPENIIGSRIVPCSDAGIKQYLKSRCPMNFVTVMLRKQALVNVGGLIDWFCEEDYYLWIRMAIAGCTFANLPTPVVNVRVSNGMYQRRGGWKYFWSERGIQKFMLRHRIISLPRYCYNVLGRFAVQVLMPDNVRSFIFQKFFRNK